MPRIGALSELWQTLRFRVALTCAVALSLALALFGGLIYGLVRYQLLRHHDGDLVAAAAAAQGIVSEADDQGLTELQREELDLSGYALRIGEVGGRLLYESPSAVQFLAPLHPAGRPAPTPQDSFTTLLDRANPVRIYSRSYRLPSGRWVAIDVAYSLGDVPAPLASLRVSMLILAPLAILLSAAGGYWLAGRALDPVDEVTRAAQEIEASRLSRRLPAPRVRDEIGRLVETFNQMIGRLESAFEAMKRFTADASHELRSPLATMRAAIDVALSRTRKPSEYREALRTVGEDVDRLRSIAEDLLVLARADAGAIQLQRAPVRLDLLAGEVVESFLPSASERSVGLSVRCPVPVLVSGDERWLRQLVVNLVDNAIKFSVLARDGADISAVSLNVSAEVAVGELAVADTGPGVPPEALDHIFERFFQADNARTHRHAEGSGLGLAIAAWIVAAHGGTIAARNRRSGGSVFTVRLPLAGAPA